jgi:hypothetical protein
MNLRLLNFGAGAVITLALLSESHAPAANNPVISSPPAQPTNAASATPDSEAQIEFLVRYAMPGQHHKLLDRMAGPWDTLTRYSPKAGADSVESAGRSTRKWILDGRFLMEELDGGNLALSFRGLGLYGYDAFEQKYTSAWMDTLNTSILTNLGLYDPAKDAVNFAGQYKDPWTGSAKKERGVIRFLGKDKHVLELYVTDPGGQERKMLEITYSRRTAK